MLEKVSKGDKKYEIGELRFDDIKIPRIADKSRRASRRRGVSDDDMSSG